MLIIFAGLSGSGKSYLARQLSEKLKCPYLNSDEVRKKIFKIDLNKKIFDDFNKGLYSPETTKKTYEELFKRAKKLLFNNKYVILDATFIDKYYQKKILELNEDFIFFYCYAPDDVIKERLDKRIKKKNEVSDGRWEIYLKQKEKFDGFAVPEEKIIKLDTSKNDLIQKIIFIIQEKND